MPLRTRSLLVVVSLVAALALEASGAQAATVKTTSANWAGYAVRRAGVAFRTVSGTWTVPNVDCSDGARRYSANWVGIGGYATSARALEQLGTESDCARSGRASSSAWFEVVPDAAITSTLTVAPGDTIHATVQVRGQVVTLKLADLTRGTSQTKAVRAATLDLTSAEWIVEAPSLCEGSSLSDVACRQTALADFGTTGFSAASATTTAGHTGTIVDPAWTNVAIALRADAQGGPGGGHARGEIGNATAGGATPAALDATGAAFSVAFGD